MSEDTETERAGATDGASPSEDEDAPEPPTTSGHVERAILHHAAGSGAPYAPTTAGEVAETVAAVIERGDYGNEGPRAPTSVARKSTVRRACNRLAEAGFLRRVESLSPAELDDERFDLGAPGAEPTDPAGYERVTDDARVTDWLLTPEGAREVERLDAAYERALDEVAARHGRPRGETTERVEA